MHVSTTIDPALMEPTRQRSDRHLFKRASIEKSGWANFPAKMRRANVCTAEAAEESLDLTQRKLENPSLQGKHDRAGSILPNIAAKRPVTSPGQLFGRLKQVDGFHNKKRLASFEVIGHHTPWLRR